MTTTIEGRLLGAICCLPRDGSLCFMQTQQAQRPPSNVVNGHELTMCIYNTVYRSLYGHIIRCRRNPISHGMHYSRPVLSDKQLCCRKQAARCFVSVSSQLQQYKRRVESFNCQLRRLQIYHCVQLNVLFCCLWRNVEASWHKHFVVFSRNQHRRLLPAMCHNQRYAGRAPPATLLTTTGLLQR